MTEHEPTCRCEPCLDARDEAANALRAGWDTAPAGFIYEAPTLTRKQRREGKANARWLARGGRTLGERMLRRPMTWGVCASPHHRTPVVVDNGTDRCDQCWHDAQAEMDAQR